MSHETVHCPHLGLKGNPKKFFETPSPMHRCYSGGAPLEIPVSQENVCLSHDHTRCPLYREPARSEPSGGVRGMFEKIPAADRTMYATIVAALVVIIIIYAVTEFSAFQNLSLTPDPAPITPNVAPTVVPTAAPSGGMFVAPAQVLASQKHAYSRF
jgi:hypothetical protein